MKISPITWLVGLAAIPVAAWLWWTGPAEEAPVGVVRRAGVPSAVAPQAPAPGEAQESVSPGEPAPLESYHDMVDRPLFASSRRPIEVAMPPDEPPSDEPTDAPTQITSIGDSYRLAGTVNENGRITALLVAPSGAYLRLERGDEIDGWRVSAIGGDRVLFVRGEEAAELRLAQ